MKYAIRRIVFPEGDFQEINHPLRIKQLVDLNGNPLSLPLPSPKTIAYEVCKIQRKETRNEEITEYHLDLMGRDELEEFADRRGPRLYSGF